MIFGILRSSRGGTPTTARLTSTPKDPFNPPGAPTLLNSDNLFTASAKSGVLC